jgi:lysozyme family protein
MSVALSDFNKKFIITRYTGIEAGYVNDPSDLGGETNHGITKGLATQYAADLKAKFGWDGTMRNLSTDAAFYLYDVEFWGKMQLDNVFSLHPLIADKMFDIGINAGKTRSVTFLQEFLNVNNNGQKLYADLVVDGGIGTKTFSALQGFVTARGKDGLKTLLHCLIARQTSYYTDISMAREANERFTWGWFGRAYNSAADYQALGYLYH